LDSDTIWLAFALLLVFEGLTPFLAPAAWKRMLLRLQDVPDHHIRMGAMWAVLVGIAMIWWLAP
jgi:uncharacterized protein